MSGRLLVVSLATSLDRYATLPPLRLGEVNRPREVIARAGGKGLNAARTAHHLGAAVKTVALVGGETGRTVRAVAAPLDVLFVDSGAETRQCLCLLGDDGVLTEVYEPVQPVTADVWPQVLAAVDAELRDAELLALSGRVPPGLPVDALAQLIDLAAEHDVPALVDSDGPALAAALSRAPALVKVNEAEAHAVAGDAGPAGLQKLGAQAVIVTTGATGASFLGPDGACLTVAHEPIPGALPVGSGDAFLAGYAVAWLRGERNPATALRIAAAAGRANARHLTAGDIDGEQIAAELPGITVTPC